MFLVPRAFVEVSAVLLFLQSADVNHFSQIEGLLTCFSDQTSSRRLSLLFLFCENNLSYMRFSFDTYFLSPRRPSSSSSLWKLSAAAQGPTRLSVFAISSSCVVSFTSRPALITSCQSEVLIGLKQTHVIPMIQSKYSTGILIITVLGYSTGSFRFSQSGCFLPPRGVKISLKLRPLPPPHTHTNDQSQSVLWPLPRIHRCRGAQQSPLLVASVGGALWT